MHIGIDFDNTIAGYDALFLRLAVDAGWVDAGFAGGKTAIRDHIRLLPDGEKSWTALQARVYGPCMGGAVLIDGVADFLSACRQGGHRVSIVSHKTRTAAAAPQGPDLRQAALAWMEAKGFFADDGFGLNRADVHFTDTRTEKCIRIGQVGCSVFIDDLEEVFEDPAFPSQVGRFLFRPAPPVPRGPFRVFDHWRPLAQAVLDHG